MVLKNSHSFDLAASGLNPSANTNAKTRSGSDIERSKLSKVELDTN